MISLLFHRLNRFFQSILALSVIHQLCKFNVYQRSRRHALWKTVRDYPSCKTTLVNNLLFKELEGNALYEPYGRHSIDTDFEYCTKEEERETTTGLRAKVVNLQQNNRPV